MKKVKLILEKTDLFKIDIVKSDNEKEDLEIKDNVLHNVRDKETTVSIGFVFQSRKYSDGSSNLRVQFTQGKGMQYAKNTGLKSLESTGFHLNVKSAVSMIIMRKLIQILMKLNQGLT